MIELQTNLLWEASPTAKFLWEASPTAKKPSRRAGRLFNVALAVALAGFSILADGVASHTAAGAQSSDPLSQAPKWQPPERQEVRDRAMAWLKENQADESTLAKADEIFSALPDSASGAQRLAALAETFSLIDENVADLVRLCSHPKRRFLLPDRPWLSDPKTPPLVAHNMRLLYGRWLVHEQMYDESLAQLDELKPQQVVAPALLLFYQSVTYHTLLQKEPGLKSIERLLSGAEAFKDAGQIPRRYVAVARLMQQDLEGLQDDTLDHIARRMGDVRRRLDLGRAGEKVRKVEDGVIESLDKLIKKLEEEQKKNGSGSSSSDNIRSSKPAPDSMPIGGKGPGDVTKRPIGAGSGWGDLPPKQREEALQQIGRDYPSHYRDVIEQYFRQLAAEETR